MSTSTPLESIAQFGAFVMIPTLGISSTCIESQGQPSHHSNCVPHDIDHDYDDIENEEEEVSHALIDLV